MKTNDPFLSAPEFVQLNAQYLVREGDDPIAVGMRYRPTRDASMKPIVAFVLAGIIGGAGGLLFALGALRPEPFPDSYHPITVAAPFVIAAASVAGGVLAAWFLTLLILSWAPGRFRCPRCGVANIPGAQSCHGCLLPFV